LTLIAIFKIIKNDEKSHQMKDILGVLLEFAPRKSSNKCFNLSKNFILMRFGVQRPQPFLVDFIMQFFDQN